ncbi:MAG: GyrI-like domain-containing protein [Roseiarcus sp.]|jgi:effector-binding domain-containing protein
MVRQGIARTGLAVVAGLLLFAAPPFLAPVHAQQAPAASPSPAPAAASPIATPSPTASAAPTPAASAAPTPTPSPSPSPAPNATPAPTPSPATSPTPTPSASPANPAGEGGSMGETLELTPHPAAYMEGKANRDEIYGAIMGSIAQIRTEIAKAGLKAAGRPIAIFLEADDVGFKYRAAIPLESSPEGKTSLSDVVKLGQTPVGKAMRFEHRGAYDDIDATYEAITAYLDEKGIDAQDMFIEEYLNDVKTTDDPNLQVDIFVLLK